MPLPKITYEDKVNKRGSTLPRKNKVIDADLNEIKAVVNALSDALGAFGGVVFVVAAAVAGQVDYTIPELDGSVIKFVQFQNAVLAPGQWALVDDTFSLNMAPEDVEAGMFINIAYTIPA